MSTDICISGKAPRYESIEKILRQRIESDYYSSTGFLPQERALAQEFKVSRNTLRSALQILSDNQLISKVQGRGTMVRRQTDEPGEYAVLNCGGNNLSSFVIMILHEIDRHASLHSGFITYTQLSSDSASELTSLQQRFSGQRNLKGILLIGNCSRKLVCQLQKIFSFPMVLIGDLWQERERSEELIVSQVVGDDYAKMYQATRYLLQQGARRIAAIGQPRELIWGNAYYNGYQDAFAEFGIDFQPEYYEAIDDYGNPRAVFHRDLSSYLQRLFQSQSRPDALIFPAEYYSTVKWLADQNELAIPEEMLLVGRSVECRRQEFPCVATNPEEMIREAFDLLKQEEENKGRVRQRRVIVPTWLDAQVSQTLNREQQV